jgi:hypothetical protein
MLPLVRLSVKHHRGQLKRYELSKEKMLPTPVSHPSLHFVVNRMLEIVNETAWGAEREDAVGEQKHALLARVCFVHQSEYIYSLGSVPSHDVVRESTSKNIEHQSNKLHEMVSSCMSYNIICMKRQRQTVAFPPCSTIPMCCSYLVCFSTILRTTSSPIKAQSLQFCRA